MDLQVPLRKVLTQIFLLLVFLFSKQLAWAQEELADLSLEQLLNVRVSSVATLFNQTALESTGAVSVVTRENWEKNNSQQLTHAVEMVPAVMSYEDDGGFNDINIRGYAVDSNGIAFFLDGIPLGLYSLGGANSNKNIDLGVLEKIELLRGPGSAIYGNEAFHGVVSMKTWSSPVDKYHAEAAVGNFGLYRASLNLSKGITSRIRLTLLGGLTSRKNENVEYQFTDINPETNAPEAGSWIEQRGINQADAVLKIKDSATSTELSLYYIGYDTDSWVGAQFPIEAPFGLQVGLRDKLYVARLSNTLTLPGQITLESALMYWSSRIYRYSEPAQNLDHLILNSFFADQRSKLDLFFKRQSDTFIPMRILLGYTLDWQNVPAVLAHNPTPLPIPNLPFQHAQRIINSVLLNTETDLIKEKLRFIAGARYDLFSSVDGNLLSPTLGFIYFVDNENSLKLIYGKSVRALGALERFPITADIIPNPNAQPEMLDTLELLSSHETQNFSLESGIFYTQWNNGLLYAPAPRQPSFITLENGEKDRRCGVETNAKVKIEKMSWFVSGSFVKSFTVEAGYQSYRSFPEVLLTWGLDYRLSALNLDIGLYNRHQWLRSEGTFFNSPSLGPYFRTDFSANWDVGPALKQKKNRYRMAFNVRNIFNRTNTIPSLNNYPGGFQEPGVSGQLSMSVTL